MNTNNFLKPKKFNIKAKSLSFESVQFMTDLEKKKIYINFVSFLNNHFSHTTFKKNLYQHFTNHCGFIAHYNINGFYGEYFGTAAKYHQVVNDVTPPQSEYCGIDMRKPNISNGEAFYRIYEEINGSRNGLGDFYDTIMSNRNWGAYSDYRDLDDAIKEAFSEYMSIWIDEIKKAVKAHSEFLKNDEIQKLKAEQDEIKSKQAALEVKNKEIETRLIKESVKAQSKPVVIQTQLSLFDFMVA
ncbi:MAG: hypothetical protein WC656_01385 [Sulfurimonas sp.]|jgi:hypothetical protein